MKSECIKKSLKSDFKNVIIAIVAFFSIIVVGYCVLKGLPIVVDIVKLSISAIGTYEWFVIIGIFSVILPFIMNMFLGSKDELSKYGSSGNYIVGVTGITSLYCVYQLDSWCKQTFTNAPAYPDVNLIFIIFVISGIVLTPFALAYVRCKDE